MSIAVQINELRKVYGGSDTAALAGLDLSIDEGTIAGVLGPNGAGKTTMLSILCGLVSPDVGTVKVLGLDVATQRTEIQRVIGIVPQQIALYPQLTAAENLLYIGKLYKLDGKLLSARIDMLLELFSLQQHAKKRIKSYSGGMQRRANIIAGLLHEPQLLILDEPTAGVDVQSRAMIHNFLSEYNKAGHTILYTSHLLEEAERLCTDVAILDQGELLAHDSPAKLVAQTKGATRLEDVFLALTGSLLRE